MQVLFVCTGNTCRSPMAAAWFHHLCKERGIGHIEVDSAGLATRPRDSVSAKAREVLAENGLIPLRLRSQLLQAKLVWSADLIMTMTGQHHELLVSRFPMATKKTRPLLTALGPGRGDVFDPYGGSLNNYRQCLDMMKPALEALLDRIL
jgi:protein-tyrosine phosphatase